MLRRVVQHTHQEGKKHLTRMQKCFHHLGNESVGPGVLHTTDTRMIVSTSRPVFNKAGIAQLGERQTEVKTQFSTHLKALCSIHSHRKTCAAIQ